MSDLTTFRVYTPTNPFVVTQRKTVLSLVPGPGSSVLSLKSRNYLVLKHTVTTVELLLYQRVLSRTHLHVHSSPSSVGPL